MVRSLPIVPRAVLDLVRSAVGLHSLDESAWKLCGKCMLHIFNKLFLNNLFSCSPSASTAPVIGLGRSPGRGPLNSEPCNCRNVSFLKNVSGINISHVDAADLVRVRLLGVKQSRWGKRVFYNICTAKNDKVDG